MSSTFFGLELSRRALSTQQAALNITGHNISNANTPGYTRQIGNMTTTSPDTMSISGRNLSLGSGVTLDTITRARDAFVDRQFRGETSKQQYWGSKQDSLTKVEGIMNEPSDSSLSGNLNKFWTAWGNLANNPQDTGTRAVVLSQTATLIDNFHSVSSQISDLQVSIDSNVKSQISQINNYATQIGDLNNQIKRAEASGDHPNDLYDSRDNAVDALSKIVTIKVSETPDSSYRVDIGDPSQTLVDGGEVSQLEGVPTPLPNSGIGGNEITAIQWKDSNNKHIASDPVDLGLKNMGTLQANMDTRDNYLTGLQGKYDTLAAGIVTAVNEIYGSGTGTGAGTKFFDDSSPVTPVTASNISISSSITANNIITGTTSASGDGSIAVAISSLSTGPLGDSYAATVTQLGVDLQQANSMKTLEDMLVSNATNQRESISGVSLDEEMTNLLKFQKSYSAAAKMVTMMDDMLSTILNMGITK